MEEKKDLTIKDENEVQTIMDSFKDGKIGRRDCLSKLKNIGLSAAAILGILGGITTRINATPQKKMKMVKAKARVSRTRIKKHKIKFSKLRTRDMMDKMKVHGMNPEIQERISKLADLGKVGFWSKSYSEYNENTGSLLDERGQIILQSSAPLTNEEIKIIDKITMR